MGREDDRHFSFQKILRKQASRTQMVVTFLSILELMKMGSIHVEQDTLFGEIRIDVITEPDTWEDLSEEI